MGEPSIFSPHDLNSQPYPHLGRPVFFTSAGKKNCKSWDKLRTVSPWKVCHFPLCIGRFFQEAGNLCGYFFFPAKKNIAPRIVEPLQQGHHCALIAWIDSWCRPLTCNLIRSPVKHIPYSRVLADELQISVRDWGLHWTRRRLPAARRTLCWRPLSPRTRGSTYHNSARETQSYEGTVTWNLGF